MMAVAWGHDNLMALQDFLPTAMAVFLAFRYSIKLSKLGFAYLYSIHAPISDLYVHGSDGIYRASSVDHAVFPLLSGALCLLI
jgi:hypothetical protein